MIKEDDDDTDRSFTYGKQHSTIPKFLPPITSP